MNSILLRLHGIASHRYFAKSLFTSIFLYGVTRINEIGISYDEVQQRKIGLVNAKYIFGDITPWLIPGNLADIPDFGNFGDAVFGVSFEVPLVILERILNLEDSRSIFLFRHLSTHLLFVFSSYLFYLLLKEIFRSNRIAGIGTALLYLSPRIYTESFYNNKDIALLSGFLIAIYTANRLANKFSIPNVIIHSLASAFVVNIRVVGVVVIPATLFLILLSNTHSQLRKKIHVVVSYLLLTSLLTYSFFPFLWKNPVRNLAIVLSKFSDYPTQEIMLFDGNLISSQSLPSTYIFRWILVTTPLIVIVLMVLGAVSCVSLIKNRYEKFEKELVDFLGFNFVIFAPIIGWVVFGGATLYNGWRHVYFLWIPVVTLGVFALHILERIRKSYPIFHFIAYIVIAASSIGTLNWFLNNKPNAHLYFNVLAKKPLHLNYDLDYWGVLNYSIMEKILLDMPNQEISVSTISDTPLETSRLILSKTERQRIEVSNLNDQPNYVIDNFFKSNDTTWQERDLYYLWKVILVNKERVAEIYKRR